MGEIGGRRRRMGHGQIGRVKRKPGERGKQAAAGGLTIEDDDQGLGWREQGKRWKVISGRK